MDEGCLHALRNELNVISVGIIMLRTRLPAELSPDVRCALDRVERAAGRCAALVSVPTPDRDPRGAE